MKFLSVCSGIEAASLAWGPLGWHAVGFAEIEKFPSALLASRFPDVPNLGDMTRHAEWEIESPDVLVGGTPCQSFSVAGLRAGMDDPRGNLALVYLAIAKRLRPRWVVWENVPGVLSSNEGRDFGSFVGGLAELGYGWAYRVLDAQFFGVPQRRERVFVVGYLGDWRRAAAVLFERACLRGDLAPSRAERKDVAGTIGARTSGGGGLGTDFDLDGGCQPVLPAMTTRTGTGTGTDGMDEYCIAHALRADGFDAGEDGTGRGTPLIAFQASDYKSGAFEESGQSRGLTTSADRTRAAPIVAFDGYNGSESDMQPTVGVNCGVSTGRNGVRSAMSVRRLMPVECERLQGMPDHWTQVSYRKKPASDGPRYKAIGNSMAVPVISWLGKRIQMVSEIQ